MKWTELEGGGAHLGVEDAVLAGEEHRQGLLLHLGG